MQTSKRHLTGRVSREQMERLEKISEEEKIDRSSALRTILDIGMKEYLKRRAAEDYRRGKISIGRAAEKAGLSVAELYGALEAEGIPIRVDVKDLRDALRSDVGQQSD
jgi:predicted HTH domain antitoxin